MQPVAVSVIIPAYNNPEYLGRALAALARQEFAGSFEVLVMDDGSPVPLEPAVLRYGDRLNLRCLRLPNGGPARARNAGARASRGEWLAFTDHDCEPQPDWLAQLFPNGDLGGPVLIGGRRVTGLPENPWSVAHDLLCVFAAGWRSEASAPFFSTENIAVSREAFLGMGGFDEEFQYAHEDREFCARWQARGFEMRSAPAAIVRHSHNFSAQSFCRQHFRYGQGAAEFYRIRSSAGPAWPLATRLRFYASLLRYSAKTLKPLKALQIGAALAVSQACYGLGYYSAVWAARRRSQSSHPSARTSSG